MGPYFYCTVDSGRSWKKESLQQSIDYIYTNKASLKDDVYIFTASSVYVFNKSSLKISQKDLPKTMAPAFSFTGGTEAKSEKVIFYALHHDPERTFRESLVILKYGDRKITEVPGNKYCIRL